MTGAISRARNSAAAKEGSLATIEWKGTIVNTRRIGVGALAGLAGGVVFGAMMHTMGMIGMVAELVGSTSVAVGWGVHLVNSAIIGAIFGAAAPPVGSWASAFGAGIVYGVVWWVLGALLIMPLWLGMPPFVIGEMQWWSLVGHLMYGLVTGVAFYALTRETGRQPAAAR